MIFSLTNILLPLVKFWTSFCDFFVPDELKAKFANFPPVFKNTEVGQKDTGENKQNYAIENDLLKHPPRMLLSSFKLENDSHNLPLFISI